MATIAKDWYGNVIGIWTKNLQGYSVEESEARTVFLAFDLANGMSFKDIIIKNNYKNMVDFL